MMQNITCCIAAQFLRKLMFQTKFNKMHCRYYSFLLSVSFSMLPYLEDMEDFVDQDISSNASITRFSSVYYLSESWTLSKYVYIWKGRQEESDWRWKQTKPRFSLASHLSLLISTNGRASKGLVNLFSLLAFYLPTLKPTSISPNALAVLLCLTEKNSGGIKTSRKVLRELKYINGGLYVQI